MLVETLVFTICRLNFCSIDTCVCHGMCLSVKHSGATDCARRDFFVDERNCLQNQGNCSAFSEEGTKNSNEFKSKYLQSHILL